MNQSDFMTAFLTTYAQNEILKKLFENDSMDNEEKSFWNLAKENAMYMPSPEVKDFIESLKRGDLVESIDCKLLKQLFINMYWHNTKTIIGFISPTLELARGFKKIVGEGKVLEIGAGTGLLAKYLEAAGIDIVATDDYSWFSRNGFQWKKYFSVEKLDFKDAIRKYKTDFLLMCWPKYDDPFAAEAAELFTELNPNGKILYIGEGSGGCTGDDLFHEGILELDPLDDINEIFPQWEGLHDNVYLVKWVGKQE